jgi:protein-disulfide isomerase
MRPRISDVAPLLALLCACSWGLSPRSKKQAEQPEPSTEPVIALTQGTPARTPARDLPGVDTSKLDAREKGEWWELATSLYSPCKEQAVPVAQCIEEKRPCAACTPMAQLIADQIHAGTAKSNTKAAVAARFSPDLVVDVPLRDSPSRGPADAAVTIVVFSDFQCPACKATLPMLETEAAAHSSELRLVHKFYPLPKHTRSKDAAYAAVAAMKQGKFWEMEKLLFENQDTLSDQDLDGFAGKLGLDMGRFHADKAAPETRGLVERDIADGEAAGLTHTPFVLINGRLFDVAYFKYDRDLDPWIVTEVTLAMAKRAGKEAPPAKAGP